MAGAVHVAKQFGAKATAIPGRQACYIDVPGTAGAAALSVVSYEVTERMGEPNTLRIVLTHPQQLARTDYLNLDAVFTIVPNDGPPRNYSGFIERFSTIDATKDFTRYEVVLKSHLARLGAVTTTRVYQHLSTPEIIVAVLERHGLKPHQYRVQLRGRYAKHAFRLQYKLDDLSYVRMLMQKAGIYCYIVETEYGDQIVFGDDIDHYLYDPPLIVPYREAAGLESSGAEAVMGGVVKNFVESEMFPWKTDFPGLNPGSKEFSEKWCAIVAENADEFVSIEHKFIKKTHFDRQISHVLAVKGVDLRYHSHTLNDVVWSVSVQHGPETDVVTNAMGKIDPSAPETKDYDRRLVDEIYAERGRTNSNGKLIRFSNSSDTVKSGIRDRYVHEREEAQGNLNDENDY